MQTVEPLNTIPLQLFIQQVKSAESSQSREIKIDIATAKNLAFTLGIVMSRLEGDLEKLVSQSSQSDEKIEIAKPIQIKSKLANGGKHFDVKFLQDTAPGLSQREQDAIERDKQFKIDRQNMSPREARKARREQRRTDRGTRTTARRETNRQNWKTFWGLDNE